MTTYIFTKVVWQYAPCFFLMALGTISSAISLAFEMRLD